MQLLPILNNVKGTVTLTETEIVQQKNYGGGTLSKKQITPW